MKQDKGKWWQLFLSFCRVSPVTFGGGFAVLPLIEKEVLHKRRWMDEQEFGEVTAIAQSIPGAVAVNVAMIIGYRLAGMVGVLWATAGIVFPAFVIVLAMCLGFYRIHTWGWVNGALEGIRAAVVALILYAAIRMGKSALSDKWTWIIMGGAVGGLFFWHVPPLVVMMSGALGGMIFVSVKHVLAIMRRNR
ncbi:chromate transporter [Laceyella putida]|uniref:Chromate transporter n=1 Tax=Laceyella putida TaxID=110101 RepID=A0ABW2RIY9_9BACL